MPRLQKNVLKPIIRRSSPEGETGYSHKNHRKTRESWEYTVQSYKLPYIPAYNTRTFDTRKIITNYRCALYTNYKNEKLIIKKKER